MAALALPPGSAAAALRVFEWQQQWLPWTLGSAQLHDILHPFLPLMSLRQAGWCSLLQVCSWQCCFLISNRQESNTVMIHAHKTSRHLYSFVSLLTSMGMLGIKGISGIRGTDSFVT